MTRADSPPLDLDPRTAAFYSDVIAAFSEAGIDFLIGGAYAFEVYTDIGNRTKDLDIFLRPRDFEAVRRAARRRRYVTEKTAPHWLGKVRSDRDFVDIIYSSGNGLCPVDDTWFANAPPAEVLGHQVRLVPLEEMIWQKAFIMERERYDGADVAHLLRAHGRTLDWERLLARFGAHWPVLLAHLVLYDYIYPSERDRVPGWVLRELVDRRAPELRATEEEHVCLGTLLSRQQYLPDVEQLAFVDGRLPPTGTLDAETIESENRRLREELTSGRR
jgi:hypothetical protein